MSHHLLTRLGRSSARAAYLQPALRSGALDAVEATNPTIRVTEPPSALGSRRARTEGAGADDLESRPTTPVTWPPQCRGSFVILTVIARFEWKEKADCARNVPCRNLIVSALPASEIFNGYYHASMGRALVTACFRILNQWNKRELLLSQR